MYKELFWCTLLALIMTVFVSFKIRQKDKPKPEEKPLYPYSVKAALRENQTFTANTKTKEEAIQVFNTLEEVMKSDTSFYSGTGTLGNIESKIIIRGKGINMIEFTGPDIKQ